jgi:aquaporin Z
VRALKEHWPEYLMEAALLGLFMASACAFGTLLEYPGSQAHQAIPDPFLRRSGAHMNPAVTAAFWRLGKVAPADAAWYVAAQIAGGLLGVIVTLSVLGRRLADPPVSTVVTIPGPWGTGAAFLAEAAITYALMLVILLATNHARFARWTGALAGALVALFITLEAPVSGMSMNPARTLASAIPAGQAQAIWIYFVAPPLGMLLAAETFVLTRGIRAVFCAKLHHTHRCRCIFCEYHAAREA